jgi:hypothetical protein
MSRHQVLTRLSRYFHVVWVNPANEWREIRTTLRQRKSQALDVPALDGFTVYFPEFWLPTMYRPGWLAKFLFRKRLRQARRLLTRRSCRKIVLYLWRPQFAPALQAIPFDLSCYHVVDEYSFSDVEVPIPEAERKLIGEVDQVFVHSSALMQKQGAINPHTELIPNGVDYELFAGPVPEPADLAPLPRPRLGYTGFLKNTLDWSLLIELVRKHPQWSFVFAGEQRQQAEVQVAVEQLSKHGNAYFLGAKSSSELAAYPQHFDVCLMPYKTNDYTKYIYPLKLHEYLASGRPTVGMRIRSLEEFAGVIGLAGTSEEWSARLAQALEPAANTAEMKARRQAVARQHDWDLLVRRIARTLAGRLGPEFAGRIPEGQTSVPEPAR